MRARRRDDSSLELLLDTITNTFGGILFLAILVSLLLRTTSRSDHHDADGGEPMTAVEAARLSVRIEELEAEIEGLRRRSDSPAEPMTQDEPLPLAEFESASARLEAALRERAQSVRETARHQEDVRSARRDLETIVDEQESIERAWTAARARRDAAREEAAELSRSALRLDRPPGPAVIEQMASLPKLRSTAKREVALYVRFGRVFMMHRWAGDTRLGPNTAQFVVTSGTPPVARPKPETGDPIKSQSIDQIVDRLLGRFPSSRFYVTCVVFEDSFDTFQTLKASLVRKGFEYNIFARRPGESIFDSGGSGQAQ